MVAAVNLYWMDMWCYVSTIPAYQPNHSQRTHSHWVWRVRRHQKSCALGCRWTPIAYRWPTASSCPHDTKATLQSSSTQLWTARRWTRVSGCDWRFSKPDASEKMDLHTERRHAVSTTLNIHRRTTNRKVNDKIAITQADEFSSRIHTEKFWRLLATTNLCTLSTRPFSKYKSIATLKWPKKIHRNPTHTHKLTHRVNTVFENLPPASHQSINRQHLYSPPPTKYGQRHGPYQ